MINTYFTIAFLILIGFVLIRVKSWAKGIPRTYEQLERSIQDLLKRGFDCGFLVITHVNSELFVQFRKYIKKAGEYGIELAFPCVIWSEDYFEELRVYCLQNDIQFSTQVESFEGNETRFLYIDFKKNTEQAYKLLAVVLFTIFSIKKTDKFYVLLSGASVKDELITEK